MIESINNSKKETSLGTSEINGILSKQNENEYQTKNGSQGESNDYKLSLSDENWEILSGNGEKDDKKKSTSKGDDLSEEEQRKVDELQKIDRKVHVHEQAHLSAAGGYARGVNYSYVTGPDGKRYASSGYVNLDTSPEKTPEATIRKASVIRKAALAPADPSPADRQIATEATKMATDAQREIAMKSTESPSKS